VSETVAIVVVDLLFQSRIRAGVEALGLDPRIADDAVSANLAVAAHPALVVIDLHAAGIDVPSVIRGAKEHGAKVLAFGRHTEPAILRAAREAGADSVVARSQLVDELPELLARLTVHHRGTETQRLE
jgi:DNA-binding response OmpR family regulator